MAQPTDTFSQYDAVGNREDLSDVISNLSPTETPLLTALRKTKATAVYHEWQTDSLAAVDLTNAVIEGDEAQTDASTASVRVGNYTQISDKVARVTGTQNAVDSAGRSDEMDYQAVKRMKELKRDMEAILFQNGARVAGSDVLARKLAGIESWIATNVSVGATGVAATGDGTDARTAGTARAFTEAMLQDIHAQAWENGGRPDTLYVGAFNKQAASGFVGNATRNVNADDKRLTAAIDVYAGDFGEITIRASRFSDPSSALLIDHDLFEIAELRPVGSVVLAKTGDTERKQILGEYTLKSNNEIGSGAVYDLTTS